MFFCVYISIFSNCLIFIFFWAFLYVKYQISCAFDGCMNRNKSPIIIIITFDTMQMLKVQLHFETWILKTLCFASCFSHHSWVRKNKCKETTAINLCRTNIMWMFARFYLKWNAKQTNKELRKNKSFTMIHNNCRYESHWIEWTLTTMTTTTIKMKRWSKKGTLSLQY